jgi:acyl-CoA ligase (AMP-forming) (exosortase A-associated)
MDFLVHHMLRANASRSPNKEAVIHSAERLTYKEVSSRTEGVAQGLVQVGLKRGDRVGIYLEASAAQVISIFGILRGQGVFVPINAALFPDQVAHIAHDCQMKGLITSRSKLETLLPKLKGIPSLEFLVLTDSGNPDETTLPLFNLEEFYPVRFPPKGREVCISKDLAAILYTSGSTGKPKGVMLNHAQIIAGASIVSDYLAITDQERILAVLPFSFDAGLNQLMTAFQQGGTVVLINFVFAREIVQMLHKESVTGLAGVPTVWSLLAQPNSTLQKNPPPRLRYITNTGGAMPQAVLKTLRETLPNTSIFLMYGLTEAFRSTFLPPEELDRRPTSMGKAIPDTEILVVNENGRPSAPGEVGELVHRGPTVSMGYWGHPELTAKVLRPHPFVPPELGDSEKVCYSGDLVKTDEDGFLYFVGRRDTMIKSSGFRISPTEVEEVIFQSGKVRGVAVIGIPDEILGQVIKVFIVLKEGALWDTESIISYCAQRMPRHMVPKSAELLEELPKTSSGKVDYPALRRGEGL